MRLNLYAMLFQRTYVGVGGRMLNQHTLCPCTSGRWNKIFYDILLSRFVLCNVDVELHARSAKGIFAYIVQDDVMAGC